ncbi:hypothetical protein Pmani_033380 [Petrolisthes manimaculis]|uniref:Uncharacterized protein n=1 Tax=Petrolisthes manimaculis TaxID=1843537 RepID=A0AAE1NRK0_9EUCA|nr:hypothetical protein Pmani_033380 [Petrolisthes manimaculis]
MYDCASGVPLTSAASKPREDAQRQALRSNVLASAPQENVHDLDLNMNSGYSLYSQVVNVWTGQLAGWLAGWGEAGRQHVASPSQPTTNSRIIIIINNTFSLTR